MHCRYIAKPGESSILLNNLTPRKTYKISVSLLFLHFGHFSNYIITNSYFATRFYLDKISEIMMRTFTRIDFRLKFLMIYSTVLLLWRFIAYSLPFSLGFTLILGLCKCFNSFPTHRYYRTWATSGSFICPFKTERC